MSDNDSKIKQRMVEYAQERADAKKSEYLVRGALLHCTKGTHARRLNLFRCHGVYVGTHPLVHEGNCVGGISDTKDNIPFFGVCNGSPAPCTQTVHYKRDVPRDKNGDPCGEASGVDDGKKCKPDILDGWQRVYSQTAIMDNGQSGGGEQCALTTDSFLICRHGGMILPYNSGQRYESDEEELANAPDQGE